MELRRVAMTENEASVILNAELIHHSEVSIFYEALSKAIKALEEVQQYRQIGTVEECREAVEKQTAIEPEKVNIPCTSWTKAHMRYRCSCGSFLTSYDDYCNKCGQKLKWGDGK
jgi:putative DNA topoisomerase I